MVSHPVACAEVPAIGWFQYTIFCGICDLWLLHQVPTNPAGKLCTRLFGAGATNYEPPGGMCSADLLRYGFLGLPGYLGGKAIEDPEIKKKKLNAELANGRPRRTFSLKASDRKAMTCVRKLRKT